MREQASSAFERIRSWITRNRLALRIAAVLGILNLVGSAILSLPPLETYLDVQIIVAFVMASFWAIPLLIFQKLFQTPMSITPGSFDVRSVMLLIVLSLLIGFSLQLLRRGKTWVKALLLTLLSALAIFNCCLGLVAFYVLPVGTTCDAPISELVRIHVVIYALGLGPGGDGNVHFLITNDGGTTYRQILTTNVRETFNSFMGGSSFFFIYCSHVESLDDQFVWLRTNLQFAVTHDGGMTWYKTHICNFELPIERCTWARIWDVKFEDAKSGQMDIDVGDVDNPITFATTDGGVTWHEAAG